jgi:SAM-dependent methyltransferase
MFLQIKSVRAGEVKPVVKLVATSQRGEILFHSQMTRASSSESNPARPPAGDTAAVCRICGNAAGNRRHLAREMMLGLRNEFAYSECGICGCVQLVQIPADMARYYPANYYSLTQHGWLKTFLRRCWALHAYQRPNPVGWLLSELVVPHEAMLAIRRTGLGKNAAILEVGCGSGRLLLDLKWLGFTNLTGVDPFIAREIRHPDGPTILKHQVETMTGEFDLVMLHHSFEHTDQPLAVMQAVARLLKPGGRAIVRIPVASSFAWREYGVNWTNFDAPRHFFLHTFESMRLLAEKTGLRLQEILHEGNDEQFWVSEEYARNIPRNDPRSLKSNLLKWMLAFQKIWRCKAKARELNLKKQGDLVCIHFQKPGQPA